MSMNPGARGAFLRNTGQAPVGGAGFNPYAAGKKGLGASPNNGPVADKTPYQERDSSAIAQRNALLRRLKARGAGRFQSPENLGYQGG